MTQEEVAKRFDWGNEQDDDYIKFKDKAPYFSHPESRKIYVWLPKDQQQVPNTAYFLACLGNKTGDFNGALLWFTDFGIWNEVSEEIGYQVIEQLHIAHGQPLPFSLGVGHDFRGDELTKAAGMIVQAIVFGWDAYFVPRWLWDSSSEFFLKFSHDEYVEISIRTNEFYEKAVQELKERGLTPRDKIVWKVSPKDEMTGTDQPPV